MLLQDLKNSKEVKVHLESGLGYYIKNNKARPFRLYSIDDKAGFYIIQNAQQVSYEHDIRRRLGEIYEYFIHNGGSYDFESHCSLFSMQFLTEKEFDKMCKTAQEKIIREYKDVDWRIQRRPKDVSDVKITLQELYPDIFLGVGLAAGYCTNEWSDD